MKRFFLWPLIYFFLFSGIATAQKTKGVVALMKVENNDTLIVYDLPACIVFGKLPKHLVSNEPKKRNEKLIANVRKVLPFAKTAGEKFREYEASLTLLTSEQEKKDLMQKAESDLRNQFEADIKKLTFRQGILLIKLVDRETGNSTYDIIRELRGKFMAFFWQTFARLFGYNLRIEYDPYGADSDIEDIVLAIESGEL